MTARPLTALLVAACAVAVVASSARADAPVTFSDLPAAHGGADFEFTLTYHTDDHPTSYVTVRDSEVEVDGGTVTQARRAHQTAEQRNYVWTVSVAPDGDPDILLKVRGVTARVPREEPDDVSDEGKTIELIEEEEPGTARQDSTSPVITTLGPFTVDEGETAVATLMAEDTDTAAADLTWSKTGGADSSHFTLTGGGVLAFAAAKDYELPDDAGNDGAYEVTVQVSDGTDTDTASLVVTLANVTELVSTITGPTAVTFAENGGGRVATFSASSDADRDGVEWTISGDDADHFTIDSPPGALRFDIDPVAPTLFAEPPDVEDPADANGDNVYALTLVARVGADVSDSHTVTVTVSDEDEPGEVTLSSTQPRVGTALTATLSDPDGVTTGTATWQWERNDGREGWLSIAGATAASYTPTAADGDRYLRVRVTYTDDFGTGKTAEAMAPHVVIAHRLGSLTVTGLTGVTRDDRAIYPAFDPDTLHYAARCTESITLTLTTENAGTRLSVNGRQRPTGQAFSVDGLHRESDIRIVLTGAMGGATTYTVHCIDREQFPRLTTEQSAGATDELLLFRAQWAPPGESWRSAMIMMDKNGVPRLRKWIDARASEYMRVFPDESHPRARYAFLKGGGGMVVMDKYFNIVDDDVHVLSPFNNTDFHDHHILPDGTYILMAYSRHERDLSALQAAFPDLRDGNGNPLGTNEAVQDSAIQVRRADGTVLLDWSSWDHMAIEDCITSSTFNREYAHINSLGLMDGDIIAGFRRCSKILRIDIDTGDVVWRAGPSVLTREQWEAGETVYGDRGPAPLDFVKDPRHGFSGQHGGDPTVDGTLLVYDNATHCEVPSGFPPRRPVVCEDRARAVEYAIDTANDELVFLREVLMPETDPMRSYGGFAGHAEPMTNGDWMISWSNTIQSNPRAPMPHTAMQADPRTGTQKLVMTLRNIVGGRGVNEPHHTRVVLVSPVALAPRIESLSATLPASGSTSVFHTGATDSPAVVVAFSRPVVDFDETSPSLGVSGATVASVSPHTVAGEPAHAYLVTLTPEGDGAITFSLVTDEACAGGGICTADGTPLTEVPGALVIGPPVTVEFASASYVVSEGGTVEVTVELSTAHQGVRAVTVPVVTAPATTASQDEFTEPPSVTFAAGERSKTFTLTVGQDDLDDDGEFVQLAFGTLPDGVGAGTTSETRVNIDDDDDPPVTVRFESAGYSVDEGESVAVVLRLDVDPERRVAIPLVVTNQDGATGSDYGGIPPRVTFESGQTMKSFTLTATQDGVDDDGESVKLGFDALPARVSRGSLDETIVAIGDDDDPPVTVRFEQSAYTVAENSAVTVRVLLSADPERTVTIPLDVTELGGATSGDYSGVPPNVTFASGQTEETFTFSAADDGEDDDGESVRLTFGELPERVSAGSIRRATVGITDDDLPVVTVDFGSGSYTVAEGGSVSITLTLSADPERTVTIPVDATPLGNTSDSDYSLAASAVTFSPGQTERTLRFSAPDDRDDDDGESVLLRLGTLPTRVDPGSEDLTIVSITDDDLTVSFGASRHLLDEGSEVTVRVRLSEDPGRTLVIPITVRPLGGASSADYTGVPRGLTFRSGETLQSFTVRATDDTLDDDGESVELGFGTLPPTVSPAGDVTTTVSITDNDVPELAVRFEQSSYAVAEGSSVTVRLVLDAPPERVVTIPLTVLEQDGASMDDYDSPPAAVTFSADQTERSFTFTAVADDNYDDGESVLLRLGALPERVSAGAIAETTVVISDDDLPQVVVGFELLAATVREGGGVIIRLQLSADPERTVTIPITVMNRGGATDGDHSGVPPPVTFESGETEQAFTLLASRDAEDDGGEWLMLGFGALPEGVSPGSIGTVTVTFRESARLSSGPIFTGGGGGGGGPSGPSPSEADFEWTVRHDLESLDPGHDTPTGMWSDGATLWLAHNASGSGDAVYAYDLERGERAREREFELDRRNLAPRGVWSDGETLWVSDSGQDRLFAHDLASGERIEEQDLALHPRNRDARGIWSGEGVMWVLDGGRDGVFAYDLESGALLGEYALDPANGDPHGLWSDGVALWVSNHDPKRLFAYRLPLPGGADAPAEAALERVRGEEFTELSEASNNSPRGLWSDGDVMYVADALDGRVYSYNMADAWDARLASLSLEGVEIGAFDPGRTGYEGNAGEVTTTTVRAEPRQHGAAVAIDPPDADEAAEGHQVALAGLEEISVTVTSADGARRTVYRVRFAAAGWDPLRDPWPHCLLGAVGEGFSLVVSAGGAVAELEACARERHVTALYALHEGGYVPYILGAPDFVNRSFTELFGGGVPALTPLVAASAGPPSPDPSPVDAAPASWPACLRGEVVAGWSLVLYAGGGVAELAACATERGVSAAYVLHEGEWVGYILGAPQFVNRPFAALFAGGLPPATPLVVRAEDADAGH